MEVNNLTNKTTRPLKYGELEIMLIRFKLRLEEYPYESIEHFICYENHVRNLFPE